MQEQLKPIFLEKIIEDKNPTLLKWLPRPILAYLKRIIHQDHLNEFIGLSGHLYGPDFAQAYLEFGNIKVRLVGEEYLPKTGGRVIFAGNHPLGGLDGIALIAKLGHRYPKMKFMVNDILSHMLNLKPVFLTINKHGKQGRDAAREIINAHNSDINIFTFPAGLVSRRQNGVIKDLAWGKNVIANSIKYQRDIVPIHVSGRNSNFFYGLSNWRKRLGIKINLEMVYLVDEAYKRHNSEIVITIGKAIPHTHFTKDKTRVEWAQELKEHVYSLPE